MKIRTPRLRSIVPMLARAALFALLFQITAIDHHWHPDASAVSGAAGSASHEMHCHGATGSCANGGGELPTAVQALATILTQPPSFSFATLESSAAPAETVIDVVTQPPRI